MTDIVERLRKGRLVNPSKAITVLINGEENTLHTGELREVPHPDALEAADEIERLRARISRLTDLERRRHD